MATRIIKLATNHKPANGDAMALFTVSQSPPKNTMPNKNPSNSLRAMPGISFIIFLLVIYVFMFVPYPLPGYHAANRQANNQKG